MKKLLILAFLTIATTVTFAQGNLEPGRNQLNAGFGLSGWGLPVYVGFDHGFKENITVGGELSFRSYNEKVSGTRYRSSLGPLS